ncbi:MAG: flagellar type III secretion system pore protein FliP [Alphaproteobacteria bacterium]|nr:flagellar type III secretion system pore protein FliP [Alphaproteobacteria bacterium]MBV9552029.1 flagellar type III secretion system pore protein FliP [Alphaproteobacteria bacterium]
MARRLSLGLALGLLFAAATAGAAHAAGIGALEMRPDGHGGQTYTMPVQLLLLMAGLVFLPAILMTMTSFTRIIIVLSLLRQALGLTQTPPNQVLIGLALFLTLFVMGPIFSRVGNDALQPLLDNKISAEDAVTKAQGPLRDFMVKQTRRDDLGLFVKLAGNQGFQSAADVPFSILVPAFVTSELKTGFQIGFLIFLPFLVIDIVVAAVMMSLGMMLLSPTSVSLPLKLALFVLVNGWTLVIGSLAEGFLR